MVFKMTAWFAFSCLFKLFFTGKKRENMPNVKQLWIENVFHTSHHAHKKEHCYEVNSMGYVNSDLFGLANNDECKYSK